MPVFVHTTFVMCVVYIHKPFQVGILQVLVRDLETYVSDLRENEEEGMD